MFQSLIMMLAITLKMLIEPAEILRMCITDDKASERAQFLKCISMQKI